MPAVTVSVVVSYQAAGTRHPCLFTLFFLTSEPHWIHSVPSPLAQGEVLHCEFRFQHTKPLVRCKVTGGSSGQLLVVLSVPLRAVTPGQVSFQEGLCYLNSVLQYYIFIQILYFFTVCCFLQRRRMYWQCPHCSTWSIFTKPWTVRTTIRHTDQETTVMIRDRIIKCCTFSK